MTLFLVYSEYGDDFRNKVIAPLTNIYSDIQVINLQEAVNCFFSDDRKWDLMLVEISSEVKDEPAKWSGATLVEGFAKLVHTCKQFVPIISCYNELEWNPLEGTYGVTTKSFNSALIADVLILWRAGLKPEKLSDNQIHELSKSYDPEYLTERKFTALLQLELPDSLDQARFVKDVHDAFERMDESAVIKEAVILMRMTRFLARLELEGSPYIMTFAFGTNLQERESLYTLGKSMLISLDPTSIPQIEDFTELVVSGGEGTRKIGGH